MEVLTFIGAFIGLLFAGYSIKYVVKDAVHEVLREERERSELVEGYTAESRKKFRKTMKERNKK